MALDLERFLGGVERVTFSLLPSRSQFIRRCRLSLSIALTLAHNPSAGIRVTASEQNAIFVGDQTSRMVSRIH